MIVARNPLRFYSSIRNIRAVFLALLLAAYRRRLCLLAAALSAFLAHAGIGEIVNHSFEKPGATWSGSVARALQRPDGNIWMIYEEPEDAHNIIDGFDTRGFYKTTVLTGNGERVPGSDRQFMVADRYTLAFFAMAVQADNKLLLGIETGEFFRFNADGSRDASFQPQISKTVGGVAVQPDGKIIVSPELVRLDPDGSKDPGFTSALSNEPLDNPVVVQSSGKIVVAVTSAPYLKRLNTDGSIDATFLATLSTDVNSMLLLPNDALLVRFQQFDANGNPTFTFQRLNADGSIDPAFHADPRCEVAYAAQSNGKILAAFLDPGPAGYFLGRMNVDGTLDSSYPIYSVGRTLDGFNPIFNVLVRPDGAIVAQVLSSIKGLQSFRFASNGVLDPAATTVFKIPAPVTKLSAQSDGKPLVSGDFNFVDHAKTGALVRLESKGDLDTTFHPPLFDSLTGGYDLAVQSSDFILFSGFGMGSFFRLTPDGSVDPNFSRFNLGWRFTVRNDDSIVTAHFDNIVRRLRPDGNGDFSFSATQVAFGGNQGDGVAAVALQPDGKIVVIGNGILNGGVHSAPIKGGVARINPDGGLDSTFLPPAFSSYSRLNCVAIQADGKILLGGRLDSSLAPTRPNVIRLNSDGSIDNTFAAAADYTVSAIVVENTGTILIGGGFSTVNGQPAQGVARLKPDGQLDQSFHLETGGAAAYALNVLEDGRILAGGDFGLVASAPAPPSRLRNISTRMFVDGGDYALIGGIIVTGTGDKRLLIRGIGPSLAGAGITGALSDPNLELRDSNGLLLASNDDWQDSANKQAIVDTTIAPADPKEAAIVTTVPANGSTYTAVVRPARGNGGIGLVEVYDLDADTGSSTLANISARGNVLPGDGAMIGGFIVTGPAGAAPSKVVIRALGPSLPLAGVLQDPLVELHQGPMTLATNDEWKQPQQLPIEKTGIPPNDDRESAIVKLLQPASPISAGTYTAIVRGKNSGTGIGLLEIYDVTK
jgi:uncharacterized delta-60 repeat protein